MRQCSSALSTMAVTPAELRRVGASNFAAISGSTEPQFTPTRSAKSLLRRGLGDERDLVTHGLRLLVVVEVAGVVANLVDVRRDLRDQPVVLLQVDDNVRLGDARPDPRERIDVLRAVDRDADETGAGVVEHLRLVRRGFDVLRLRGAHRLDDDGVAATDGDGAGADGSGVGSLHVQKCSRDAAKPR